MLAAGWRMNCGIKGWKGNHLGSYYSGPDRKNSGLGKESKVAVGKWKGLDIVKLKFPSDQSWSPLHVHIK